MCKYNQLTRNDHQFPSRSSPSFHSSAHRCKCSTCPLLSIDRDELKALRRNFQESVQSNNDMYLIKKCLRYDWNAVLVACLTISNSFHDALTRTTTDGCNVYKVDKIHRATSGNKKVRKRQDSMDQLCHAVEAGKRQLLALDRFGNTPLHAVCYHKPPICVVAALLESASMIPSTLALTSTTAHSNKDQSQASTNNCGAHTEPAQLHLKFNDKIATPLTIACTAGASVLVIQELLYPRYAGLVRGGAAVKTMAATSTRNLYITPLDGLVRRYEMMSWSQQHQQQISLKYVFPIQEESEPLPVASSIVHANPSFPLSDHETKNGKLSPCFRVNVQPKSSSSCTAKTLIKPSASLENFWRTMEMMIEAAWFMDCDRRKNEPYGFHGTLANGHDNAIAPYQYGRIATSTSIIELVTNDCKKTEYTSAKYSFERSSSPSVLHGAAYISEYVPPIITDLLIRCHPELVSTPLIASAPTAMDAQNEINESRSSMLPLHLAITGSYNTDGQENTNAFLHRKHQQTYFISQLLKADPPTTNVPVPGMGGRTPFHVAIASGLSWHISPLTPTVSGDSSERSTPPSVGMTFDTDSFQDKEQTFGPIQLLWKYSPDSLELVDPVTGLSPFLLAASVSSNPPLLTTTSPTAFLEETSIPIGIEQRELLQLDTIYCLLRLAPHQAKVVKYS